MAHLNLFFFGNPRVDIDNVKADPGRRKSVALICYLAVTERFHSRDTLAAMFWPEYSENDARASLRRALASLKAALQEDWLVIDRESIGLKQTSALWVDLRHWNSLLAETRTHGHSEAVVCDVCLHLLGEAVQLYQADFLSGFNLPDCPDFDEWVFFERENLRQEFASVLERLTRGYCERGAFDPAITYTLRWLQLDTLQEAVQRQLMRLYAWAGHEADALRQFELCQHVLQEIDALPDEETVVLAEAIRAGTLPDWDTSFKPVIIVPQKHLPIQPTEFIGRSAELAEIGARLADPTYRLLTLVGPGGTGKTRLALRIGELYASQFAHGVHFIPLAPVTTPSLLVSAIASGIGLTFYNQGDLKTQLLSYLSDKHVLLILDNFEHLLTDVTLISEILLNAPSLKIICTSRGLLNLHDESVIPILEMAYPRDRDEAAEHYDAVQLFLQSARRVQPAFTYAENQKEAVRICQLVQGMPLALDLAAGWLNLMSVGQIAERLEQNHDLLTSSARDLPERHRNMRSILDQTWKMLSPLEQELLSQLSIFRGGFSIEAMEQITQTPLQTLASLAGKVLVRREADFHYSLHELLRQYAAEHLQAHPQQDHLLHQRFCAYYARFMVDKEAALYSNAQKTARIAIDAEIDNVRAAWQWATQHPLSDVLDQMMMSVERYYEARGWLKERADLFMLAYESLSFHETSVPDHVLARLRARQGWAYLFIERREEGYLYLRASLAWFREHDEKLDTARTSIALGYGLMNYERAYDEADELFQEAIRLLKPMRERRALEAQAEALLYLGKNASFIGAYPEARSFYERSLALGQRLSNPLAVSEALSAMGVLAIMREAFDEARHWLEEALALNARYEHKGRMAKDLNRLAVIELRQQHHNEAIAYYERCLTLYRELGDRKSESACLIGLGVSAYYAKNYEEALRYYRAALALAREMGEQEEIANVLTNIGIIYWEQGSNYSEAKRLVQESLAIHRKLAVPSMIATTLASLGIITFACDAVVESYTYLWESLEISISLKLTPQILSACSWMPFCLVEMGEPETAYTLYLLLLTYPDITTDNESWNRPAADFLSKISPELKAAVETQISNVTLDEVIAHLLEHPPT